MSGTPAAPRQALRRALADRAGAVAIEFAILAPLMVMVLMGVIEFGRVLWAENALQYAVAETARCVRINATVCGSMRETQDFAATTSGMTFPRSIFHVSLAPCGIEVSARYVFKFIVPVLPRPVILTAQSCFPI